MQGRGWEGRRCGEDYPLIPYFTNIYLVPTANLALCGRGRGLETHFGVND